MFDIGGWEFLLIAVIAIIVIGPKDLPGTIRNVTGWIRRARELAREFQSGLDDIAQEADIDSVKEDLKSGLGLDEFSDTGNSIRNEFEQTIDPDGEIKNTFSEDFQLPDDDDPFLKDYVDEDDEEDEELDDIDPKYKTSEAMTEPETDDAAVQNEEDARDEGEPAAVETVKKA